MQDDLAGLVEFAKGEYADCLLDNMPIMAETYLAIATTLEAQAREIAELRGEVAERTEEQMIETAERDQALASIGATEEEV